MCIGVSLHNTNLCVQLNVIKMPVQFIKRGNNVHSNQSSLKKIFVVVHAVIQNILNGG